VGFIKRFVVLLKLYQLDRFRDLYAYTLMSRWTVVIPEKTNRMVRTHLALRGAKKGDLSKFVDQAVRQALFHETVDTIKDRNREMPADLIEAAIEETVDWARETRS
jgi:23S rRNA G2445 N2-methylase RlmL